MPRITLPGDDQWVEFIDPEQINRGHIRKIRLAFASADSFVERMELAREAVLTTCITNWTLEKPIPSKEKDPLVILDSLDRPTWYALEKAADEYMANHLGDPATSGQVEAAPSDPQTPSDE